MRVQTDRYNVNVPVPADIELAYAFILLAAIAFASGVILSGVPRDRLSLNPVACFRAVVHSATRRGQSVFWIVWVLFSLAAILLVAGLLMLAAAMLNGSG